MLTLLRKGAQTWVAKILFLLLLASFAVWGVSGSMFSGGGDTVVTVGDTEVSATEFRLAYDRQLSLLSQQFGQRLSSEQARAFGVENQVYRQMVAGAALDEQASEMGLGLSEDRLAGLIAEDPAFQGTDGRFDRQNFAMVLNNVGMSEDDYIRSRQQDAVRTQIIEAVGDGFAYPDTMLDAIARHRAETRTLDYVLVDESMIEPVGTPDDETLQAYFEENSDRYRAPEYRSFAYVTLTPEAVADPQSISDEAVKADYEAHADQFTTPERRTLDQLVLSDPQAAETAADAIADGASFEDVVADAGRTMEDVRIGSFTRDSMSNPALAEAAFAIPAEGGVSDVVEGPFGPVILRVAEIEEGSSEPLAQVEQQIREELALRDASDIIFDVYNSYEDARAGGASLQEAAQQQQLEPVVVEAIDRSGQTPDGEILEDLPLSQQLIADVFESDIGVEAPALSIGSNGYVWFEVLDIEEERDQSLDEVRDEVVADWQAEQTAAALEARAAELQERLTDGEALQAIAADLDTTVQTEYGLQRTSEDQIFGPAAIAAAFGGPEGHVATSRAANGSGHVLMQVEEVAMSASNALSDEEREAIAQSGYSDLLDQLVNSLQTRYPVQINQSLGQQALSF